MITSLSLSHFKCFHEVENIKLSRLTLFTGINGRGKSSLLQSLLLLSQSRRTKEKTNSDDLLINGEWVKLGIFDDILNRNSKDKRITIHFITDDEKENDIKCTYEANSSNNRQGKLVVLNVCGESYFTIPAMDDNLVGDISNGNQAISPTSAIKGMNSLTKFHYISADRLGPTNYVEKDDLIDKKSIGIHGEHLLNLLSEDAKLVVHAEEILSRIMTGGSINITNESKSNFIQLYLDSFDDGKQGFRPTNVGFGYSYVLPLVLVGLIAKENDIIVIENPEAHLHPSAQSRLMDFFIKDVIKGKSVQVLMETHSDHILNASLIGVNEKTLSDDELSILFCDTCSENESEGCQVKNITVTTEGTVLNAPKGFFDQYSSDLKRLLGF